MSRSNTIPLELFKKIHKSMPILCVDIVIKAGKDVLLLKRANKPAKGMWWFPGGRVLKGESIIQAAKRKIKQEIGLTVKTVKILGVDETLFPDGPFGWSTHTVNIVCLAGLPSKSLKLKIDDQSEEYAWFGKAKPDFHPYVKKFISSANKNPINGVR